jgi:hypothetical protein
MYINHNLSHNIYYKIIEIKHVISKVLIVQLYLNILKSGLVWFRFVWFRVISDFRSFGFGSSRILGRLISCHLMFRIVWVQIGLDFGSSDLGSSRISGRLISSHLEFRVVRVQIGSSFGLSDLGSSQVSDRSGSDWVGFRVVWSRIVSDFRSDFGSGRIEFCALCSRVVSDFRSSWVGSGRIRISLTFLKNQIELGSDSNESDGFFRSNQVRI